MTRLKISVTEARLNRALDAYIAEGVMWSWREAGPYIYQLIRDTSAKPGGLFGSSPDRRITEATITVIPMLGSVKNNDDAKKIFTDMRHRAAMTKALEAL